jgi:hypothetical protein
MPDGGRDILHKNRIPISEGLFKGIQLFFNIH